MCFPGFNGVSPSPPAPNEGEILMNDKEKILDHFNGNFREFYGQWLDLEPINNSQNWRYKATCPFHSGDSKASFHVDKDGRYKCFGCEASGDIFDFYAQENALNTSDDFPQVLEELSDDFGIKISDNGKKDTWNYIPGSVVETLHENLTSSPKLKYLTQVRGLSEEVIETYKLGYDGQRYTIPVFTKSGRVRDIRRYDPQKQDFKNLPWKTFHDKKAAEKLGIELNWNDGAEKYEPANKGNGSPYLFPLYPKDPFKGKEIMVCEGEFDALRAITEGFNAVTNTGGVSSWKDKWTDKLEGKNVVLALDNDKAGEEETKKRAKQLEKADKLKVVEWSEDFPEGGDVSDWLNDGKDLTKVAKPIKPGYDVSPNSLQEAKEVFNKWLYLEDDSFLDVVFGAIVANRFDADPTWLMIIAPPGGTKSETIRAFFDSSETYDLSSLTSSSLISGDREAEGDPSLLPKLDGKVVLIKDFTMILDLHKEERKEILGTLRDAYDGEAAKAFGTGEIKRYESQFGLITGVTPVIDQYSSVQSTLGERFLKIRPQIGNQKKQATKALENAQNKGKMREELKEAAHGVLAQDYDSLPEYEEGLAEKLISLAQFTAIGRSSVNRGHGGKEILSDPAAEIPTRLVQQFGTLAKGIAIVKGHKEVGEPEYNLIKQVAKDTVAKRDEKVLKFLWDFKEEGKVTHTEIADRIDYTTTTTRRICEDYSLLGAINGKDVHGSGSRATWELTREFKELISEAEIYEEIPPF